MGRVRRDPAQGLARRPEQDIVDQWLVLEGDDRDLVRHGQDNGEVGYVEQLRFPVRKPASAGERLALGTIPVTTGNGQRPLAALWANPVMGSRRWIVPLLGGPPATRLTITKRA